MPTWEDYSGMINVKDPDYGAAGDGSNDDTAEIQAAFNAAYGTTGSPHGTSYYTNKAVYFPPGHYKITSPINVKHVIGAKIIGSGRLTTTINNVTASSKAFVTNGFSYSYVEGIRFVADAVGFDMDWDNSAGGAALQANTFRDCYFEGPDIGVLIGGTGFMGSETIFENCHFFGNATAGLKVANANALQIAIIGGNFQSCAIGVWAANGAVSYIQNVGFQSQTDCDIKVTNSADDTMVISACRSESEKFVMASAQNVLVEGCTQTLPSANIFAEISHRGCIKNCYSVDGTVNLNGSIEESAFGLDAWLHGGFTNATVRNVKIGLTDVGAGSGTPVSIASGFITGNPSTLYRTDVAVTVANLPPAADFTGRRFLVSNANATTFMSTVAGGGANIVPVVSDGTNWKIG